MSSGDKNSRSQQLPQKPDHSGVLLFLRELPQQQRQLVAIRVQFEYDQMAVFSKHLILLLGTNSATTKYNIQPGASPAGKFKAH